MKRGMMIKHQGGCYCGNIRFQTEYDPMLVMNCHCRTCKKLGGATLSTSASYNVSEVEITGNYKTFTYKGDSGNNLYSDFCSNCGCKLFTRVDLIEGIVYVHLGVFDDHDIFKPKIEIWDDYKCSWIKDDGCIQESFPDNGTLERIQQFLENMDQRE